MDLNQSWNQNSFQHGTPQYPPPGAGYRGPYPNHSPQPGYSPGLSRTERLEAQRLAEEARFSFEGYQVVRRDFLASRFDPIMTVRLNSITFNSTCISKLEDATYIQFMINSTELKLAIRSCDEGARDAVRWCIVRDDRRKSREITCKPFTAKLYNMMKWDSHLRYRIQGMRMMHEGIPVYVFDLSCVEPYLPQKKDPETGRYTASPKIVPNEWLNSFGMNVADHDASQKIDLMRGFTIPSLKDSQIEMDEVFK